MGSFLLLFFHTVILTMSLYVIKANATLQDPGSTGQKHKSYILQYKVEIDWLHGETSAIAGHFIFLSKPFNKAIWYCWEFMKSSHASVFVQELPEYAVIISLSTVDLHF